MTMDEALRRLDEAIYNYEHCEDAVKGEYEKAIYKANETYLDMVVEELGIIKEA